LRGHEEPDATICERVEELLAAFATFADAAR
jgi:hypothetical protein